MKMLWVAGAVLGFGIVASVSLSSKPAAAQQACTSNGSPFTDSNGVSCCTGDLVPGPNNQGSVCPTSTQRYSQAPNPARGGMVSTALGGASVRATRGFSGALSDQYSDGNLGDLFVYPNGKPGEPNFSQYAPLESAFQARFPIVTHAPPPAPYRFFATSFGGGFSESGVAAQSGSYYGGLIGVDYRAMPNLLVGAAVGGSGADVALASASGQTRGVNGALYAIANMGAFYGQSLTTLSSFTNTTNRSPAAGDLEHASFGSFEVRTRAEFGRTYALGDIFGLPKAKVTPFVALEIAQLHLNGHSEFNTTGIGNANSITTAGQDIADIPAFVGARFETSYDVGNGMVLTPIVRLAYVHQFASLAATANTFLASGTTSFSPNGTLLGRNSAQTKAGFELSLGHGTVIFANFDGLFSSTDSLYGGRGGVRVGF